MIKKIKEMVNRTQKQLINENSLGHRKKSTGRPLSMDEDDEKFVLDCIESKSTAHGRRDDSVIYLNHRVKKMDFNRLQRNLKPIKSSTTVFNRARPANKRSHQAKRYLGLGLFCGKKPPKVESNENELTHHQRAYKKYNHSQVLY